MSRKIKNVIMIILIIALSISMFFTLNYQKNNIENRRMPSGMENMNFGGNRPDNMPEIPNGISMQSTMGEPPAKPEENENTISSNTDRRMMRQGQERPENMNEDMAKRFGKSNIIINVLLGIEAFGITALVIYLVMSKFNKLSVKETFSDKNHLIIYIILVVLITAIVTLLLMVLNKNNIRGNRANDRMMIPGEEVVTEKETKATDVDSGENIEEKEINLNEHTSNITITEAGSYKITGSFNNSILVNAKGEVTLNLENVTVKNEITAAIVNISTNSLIINLPENTTNILQDGGSSEYDSCIYSAGPLTIIGNGNLEVYGKQEEGEGIATETNNITINSGNIKIESNDDGINAGGDGGTITINDGTIYIKASGDGIDSNKDVVINGGSVYTIGSARGGDAGMDADQGITINGGSVIAIGSDMLEKPLDSSKQKSICLNLENNIESGSNIILKNEKNEEIARFTANEQFRTLIISNEKISSETYYLYNGEEKITEIKNS